MKYYFLIVVALISSCCASCYSQTSIETDRPDQTETTATVPAGRFQAEIGFLHEKQGEDERAFEVPVALLKFGISSNVELRLGLEVANEKEQEEISNGLKPLRLGSKFKIYEEQGFWPAVSILAEAALPKLASSDFKLENVAATARLLFQNTLSESVEIGYNAGLEWDGDSSRPEYLYSISPNYEINEHLTAFAEAYGYFQKNHHAEQWIDGGFSILLSDAVQLDFSAGYELTHTQHFHNFFESVGFSFRI